MSVILKPQIPPTQAFRVNMAASVAVARALGGLYDLDVRIKWPNDIMVGDKKISGILTEIGADMDCLNYAVVGIGINANIDQQSLPEEGRATSISRELGRDVLLVELASRVLAEVERCSGDLTSSFDLIHLEWSQRSATLGRRVPPGGEGRRPNRTRSSRRLRPPQTIRINGPGRGKAYRDLRQKVGGRLLVVGVF